MSPVFEPFPLTPLTSAALGHIKVSLQLADPSRVHYGPGDPVEGRIRLDYIAAGSLAGSFDLARPCRIFVTLRGLMLVRAVPGKMVLGVASRDGDSYLGRSITTLFEREVCVFDGRMSGLTPRTSRQAKFSVCFPDGIDGSLGCFEGWEDDWEHAGDAKRDAKHASYTDGSDDEHRSTYNMDPSQPLPPSMTLTERPGPHKAIVNGSDKSEIAVVYDLFAKVEMPGTDVAMRYPSVRVEEGVFEHNGSFYRAFSWGQPVLYEQSWLGQQRYPQQNGGSQEGTQTRSGQVDLKDAQGPSSEPVSGLRAKLAAKITHLAHRHPFSWQMQCQEAVHQGQLLVIRVQVKPFASISADPSDGKTMKPPAPPVSIELANMSVRATAFVEARMKIGSRGQQDLAGEEGAGEEALDLDRARETPWLLDGRMAGLSKSVFCAEDDWVLDVPFSTITGKLTTSFSTPCVRRSYVVSVKCCVRVGGSKKEETFQHSFPVTVLPPLSADASTAPPLALAAPTYVAANTSGETLPPYEP
ncbi:uncharacterized protein B0I36DRAFT_358802 [Microdochium trichocladiopsis]|uniref:Uncharacterized protein n=1 Tax=Microdochium trichocladiopsis TaxID=1682393 RepID=A0A9P8YD59_9PEZI|nr:uncharacterized protein B0I36DRAFT_358802 [Microdochium trichocladiopsis]KAH7037054.1 hypothetical protein B0I36DRAFT_358802 [Microdochium trichocladiopsis]